MATSTVSYKYGPQIGNDRSRDRDRNKNKYRDGEVTNTMKRYTRNKRGGDRRRKNKRTEYSRKRRR